MKNFNDRLEYAMRRAELSQVALAEIVPIKQPSIHRLLREGGGSRFVCRIARACNVNPYWLETGDGPVDAIVPNDQLILRAIDLLSQLDEADKYRAIDYIELLSIRGEVKSKQKN